MSKSSSIDRCTKPLIAKSNIQVDRILKQGQGYFCTKDGTKGYKHPKINLKGIERRGKGVEVCLHLHVTLNLAYGSAGHCKSR